MKLILLSLSWLAGICLGSWAGYPWVAVLAIVSVALLAFALRRSQALLLCLCLVALLGGILRIQADSIAADENTLKLCNDKGAVQIKGMVAADPELDCGLVSLFNRLMVFTKALVIQIHSFLSDLSCLDFFIWMPSIPSRIEDSGRMSLLTKEIIDSAIFVRIT